MAIVLDRAHQMVYTDRSGKVFDLLTGYEVEDVPTTEVPLWGYFLDENGIEHHISELFYGATPDFRATKVEAVYTIDSLHQDPAHILSIPVKGHIFYKILVEINVTDDGSVCSQVIARVSSPEIQGDIYANTFHICGNMISQKLAFNTGLFQVSHDVNLTMSLEFNHPTTPSIPVSGAARLISYA